jgi:hypothetical protein|tara:strand:+ start:636 stop:995 length:360 start_codon:yes stop_codon:yes gene_type:complete
VNYLALAVICISGIGEDSGFGLYRAYDQSAEGRVEKIVGNFTLSKPVDELEVVYPDENLILDSNNVLSATGKIDNGQAVILDGNILGDPVVKAPIGKDVRLTGDFDKVLVDLLVKRLNR